MKYLYSVLSLILLAWIGSTLWSRYTIESPTYTKVAKLKKFELRNYDSYIVAEVAVTGNYQEGINNGFRVLAGYIFGDNRSDQKIKMTAPVTESQGMKIKMTAPVTETMKAGSRVLAFVMPRKFSLNTLPQPNNKAISFRVIPRRTLAVMSFTLNASANKVASKKESLLKAVRDEEYQVIGSPTYAGFSPPFSFPLLKKHEVWVEVEPTQQ